MKMFRKLVSIVAAATVLTSSMAFSFSAGAAQVDDTASVSSSPNLQDNVGDGVVLHAFNWSYNAIKQNLPQIAAAGYSTVQTSPVTQPKNYGMSSDVANQWWKLYQPVSLSIAKSSWLGTRDDLKSLCAEADKYGIKIIVDIVANHMANNVSAAGVDIPDQLGPEVKTYEPTLYNSYSTYFHRETYDASDSSAETMTRGHVSACPDLNTANSTVQQKILALLKDCVDCGVDGFRFDAAKHIETEADGNVMSQFWANTLDQAASYYKTKTGKDLFAYGEILNTISGRNLNAYTKRMRVTDNKAGDGILSGVNGNRAAQAATTSWPLGAGASKSVLWAESHDTYMGNSGSMGLQNTSGVPNEKVVKAWAIVAARQGSTPLFFVRPGSSLMGEASNDVTYKSTVVSEVNKFHNAFAKVSSEKVGTSGNIVYVARGNSGVVLSNVSGNAASVNISGTGLANGSYVDTVTGNTFTVSGGNLTGNIGSTGVAVVYNSTATPKATASVESGNFSTNSITVKLGLENAVSGTYALEDYAPVTFTGTPTIRIGSDYNVGETVTLNLTATDASGNKTTNTYYYTKKPSTTSGIYVFLKSSIASGWSNVSCYVYDEDTKQKKITYSNGGWPGQPMTLDTSTGYYYIEIPATCVEQNATTGAVSDSNFDLPHSSNTYVIFNGTKNNVTTQYPGANVADSQKLRLGGGSSNKVLDSANTSGWKNTTMTPATTTVEATEVLKGGEHASSEPASSEPITSEPISTEPETKFVQLGTYGDADGDGKITVSDVSAIQRHLAEFEPPLTGTNLILADVDKDGAVSIKDVSCIQMFLAEYPSGYAHTNEPYGEYVEVDPDAEKFTVTAKSNLFATKTAKIDADTNTFTVTYFMNSEKDFLSTDWILTYDNTALQPVANQQFMPKVGGATYNTNPTSVTNGGVFGNASVISLIPMKTEDNKQVPFVSITFNVLNAKDTVVDLNVKDLVLSKLNSGESTSKEANETVLMDNGVLKKPDSKYTLYTSIYTGSLNESYTNASDPKVEYDPNVAPTTDVIPSSEPDTNPTTRRILFSNNKGWSGVNIHYWDADGNGTEWPGVPMTLYKEDNGYGEPQYSFEIPTNVVGMVFNDGVNDSNNQTVDVVYDSVATGWYPTAEQDELGHWLTESWIDENPEPDPSHGDDPSETRRIEFTDNKGWGSVNIHYWDADGNGTEWPGVGMNKKGDNGYGGINYWYDVPTNIVGMVFNGPGGQTVDVQYDSTSTGWYPTDQQDGEGKWYVDSWTSTDPTDGGGTGGTREILFTNNKGWESVYIHYWGSESGDTSWPGAQMTYVKNNDYGEPQYKYSVPTDIDGMVFSNGGGDQTEDAIYDNTSTGWYPTNEKDGSGHWKVGSWSDGNTPSTGDYFLVGYINGQDVSGTDYKFNNGTITMNFSEDSYVCIRNAAGNWFMANGFPGMDVTSTTLYSTDITGEKSDKLWAPAGSVTFTLTANNDGTFTLSEGDGGDTPVPDNTRTIKFTNNKGWSNVYVYYYGGASSAVWPGVQMTSCGNNDYGEPQFSADVPTDSTLLVFSNGGDIQTVDVPYNNDVEGWYPTEMNGDGNYEVGSYGAPGNTRTIKFTNNKGWSSVYVYYYGGSSSAVWPGVQMTSCGNNGYGEPQFSADVPTDSTLLVFSNGGDVQTVDVTYNNDVTGWYPTNMNGDGDYEVESFTEGEEDPSGTRTIKFTNNKGWSSVFVYYYGGASSAVWPGVAMSPCGNNDFGEPQFSANVPTDSTLLVFSNGGTIQTVDVPYNNDVTGWYPTDMNGDGEYEVGSYRDGDQPSNTRLIKFTDNKGWGSVNIHYWFADGNGDTTWPGVAMTYCGNNDYGQAQYSFNIPTNVAGMVFNGPGGQTVDVQYDGNCTGWYPQDNTDGAGHYYVSTWTE